MRGYNHKIAVITLMVMRTITQLLTTFIDKYNNDIIIHRDILSLIRILTVHNILLIIMFVTQLKFHKKKTLLFFVIISNLSLYTLAFE